MALGFSSRVKSYIRPKLRKRPKSSDSASTCTATSKRVCKVPTEPTVTVRPSLEREETFDEQLGSSLLQKLPLELRKMVYAHVFQGPNDHMYHEPRGRHLHFKDGHWVHTRCVMYAQDDENMDSIQMQMDIVRQSRHAVEGDLLRWQRRLGSTWGHRHWRCGERVEYDKPRSIDRTGLGALMLVCKKMYPEVMETFVESHKFIFNDLFAAYRFFVQPGSPHLRHIRELDLTLSVAFHELTPFLTIGRPETDNHDNHDNHATVAVVQNSRLGAILGVVAKQITCLHNLRVSLDVYDRGPWRKLPERAVSAQLLEHIRVLRGKQGECNYTVELPAALPIRTHYSGMQYIDDAAVGEENESTRGQLPFRIIRRPALRYWQFTPGEVEHFSWETCDGEKQQQHCWIVLSKHARFISNPYLLDFSDR
ncbi:hypothetical protein GGR57DRAFT_182092 [Xylariaceae sp. FL1272]|nr:hypothetical protein GGR57DRAFT_182092 [Xylariaceae sp. FL1272]